MSDRTIPPVSYSTGYYQRVPTCAGAQGRGARWNSRAAASPPAWSTCKRDATCSTPFRPQSHPVHHRPLSTLQRTVRCRSSRWCPTIRCVPSWFLQPTRYQVASRLVLQGTGAKSSDAVAAPGHQSDGLVRLTGKTRMRICTAV